MDGDAAAAGEVARLEERAALYYTASLASMERIEKGVALREPSMRLLQPAGNTPTMAEMEKMKELARVVESCCHRLSQQHQQQQQD